MDRFRLVELCQKIDQALIALNEVRSDLVEAFGDDCGLGLSISAEAPRAVRRNLRRLADRLPVGECGLRVVHS